MVNTPRAMPNSEFAAILTAVYVPVIALMVCIYGGKQLRRWWRKQKLNIPDEEENVRTISGPLWDKWTYTRTGFRRRSPIRSSQALMP